MSTGQKRFPKSIDDPAQILLWSVDEIMPLVVIFGIGLVMQKLAYSIVVIIIFVRIYRRFRDGRQAGFFYHLLYWYGFAGAETITVRNPFIRRFLP